MSNVFASFTFIWADWCWFLLSTSEHPSPCLRPWTHLSTPSSCTSNKTYTALPQETHVLRLLIDQSSLRNFFRKALYVPFNFGCKTTKPHHKSEIFVLLELFHVFLAVNHFALVNSSPYLNHLCGRLYSFIEKASLSIVPQVWAFTFRRISLTMWILFLFCIFRYFYRLLNVWDPTVEPSMELF